MPSIPRSQAAWNDFADSLKRIGEKITAPTGARGDRERAEGYRYLLRLISAAHDLEMEADRRFPHLTRMMTPIRKFKGDGTDTLYREAKLDEGLDYRYTIRAFENGYLTRVTAGNEGAFVTTDGLTMRRSEDVAEALRRVFESRH